MNAFVLAAFQKFGGAPAPLVGLFTSDEEIGSPACRPIIEAEARRARAVFNSEPGRPSGNVVTGRKGGVFMKMEITGKAAHSGGNFTDGISAIEELARKITALHAITDLTKGTTVNVGLISGGQTVNTVAPWAKCEIDLRYVTPPDREAAMGKIERIVETSNVPGTSATLEIAGEFKPLVEGPENKRLFEHYASCARDLDLKVEGEFTGGCADFRLHGGRRHADHLRGRPGRRQGAHAGGISGGRLARPARADAGARGRAIDLSQPRRHLSSAPFSATPPSHRAPSTMTSALFSPYKINQLELANRVVVAPMCQYSASDGMPTDWHMTHLGMLANSGASLVVVEATGVERRGRITHGCTGIYSDASEDAFARIVAHCKRIGTAKLGIQLAHAGRKASSARPWEGGLGLKPGEDPVADDRSVGDCARRRVARAARDGRGGHGARCATPSSTRRSAPLRIGFDSIELHMAHGYLLHSFVSPISNKRNDAYGGSLEGRMKFPLEVLRAVRAVRAEGHAARRAHLLRRTGWRAG